MSHEKDICSLFAALADNVESVSDEELLAEVRDDGCNPEEVGHEMRVFIENTVKAFKQRALIAAKEQHQREKARLTGAALRVPPGAGERLQLLNTIIARQQQAGRMLTAQNREFREMTDEDVESWLQQFAALGLVDDEPESNK